MMAPSALSQVPVAVPIHTDTSSLPRSLFKATFGFCFNGSIFLWSCWLGLENYKLTVEEPIRGLHVSATSQQTQGWSFTFKFRRCKEPPLHLYKNKEPYTATIVSVERLVGLKAPGETCHIVIDHGGNVPYWEGQSYGVIPPGENPKKPGSPHNVRLYSIASTRYGDSFDGKTASLCVRRAVYYDPQTGKEDPSKNGVCSNFLCDSKPGDKVQITGPSGKIMLLPEDNPNATHIMIATGTGVAPFRGYLRRMFMESVPTFKFGGLAWLFLGVANGDSILYDEEFSKYLREYPDNFRYDRALSREQKNRSGGKMYVQDKIEEYSDEIFRLLDAGAHIYFCGLKGMMPGIQDTLKKSPSREEKAGMRSSLN
ncbi:UNVERIFIED_CONTAM: Ferredoxin--NADP reductase, root-type isozyme, chloroplastic [Sesamum angustifolium]|uniref:Ferredoxin--NADP reductase, chloroplastic n=1 Tax=Sesamum angustifolium TaxID=2727405 RepID=A0AAW2PC12_9LAMI